MQHPAGASCAPGVLRHAGRCSRWVSVLAPYIPWALMCFACNHCIRPCKLYRRALISGPPCAPAPWSAEASACVLGSSMARCAHMRVPAVVIQTPVHLFSFIAQGPIIAQGLRGTHVLAPAGLPAAHGSSKCISSSSKLDPWAGRWRSGWGSCCHYSTPSELLWCLLGPVLPA